MADTAYTNRDYAAIRQQMLADAASKTPEWTNFNVADLGVAILELLAGGLDILSYSLDSHALETFLPTVLTKRSAQALLRGLGYEMRRRTAATVNVTFTLSAPHGAPITIPAGTVVATEDDITFVVKEDAVIEAGLTTVDAICYQGTYHEEGPFAASGDDEQNLPLTFKDVAENFLEVSVDGVLWTEEKKVSPFPTLLQTIFRVEEDFENNVSLRFSKYLGQAPALNDPITVVYVSTDAEIGNIGAGLITKLISSVSLPGGLTLSVNNATQAGGGLERETVAEAKINGPRAFRTLERAVTQQDFIDLLLAQSGVNAVNTLNFAGFLAIYLRLNPVGGSFPLFRVPPPYIQTLIASATGGSITDDTEVFVAVTAIDANGRETNYRSINPDGGAERLNPGSVTTGSPNSDLNSLSVQIAEVPVGAVGFNVYAGTSVLEMRRVNGTVLSPSEVVSSAYVITAVPTITAVAPTENLAGEQNAVSGRSYYQDLFDILEARRILCTSFELFNAVAAPQSITVRIQVRPNYKRAEVETSVEAAVEGFFAARPIGEPFYLSDLESTILSTVAGVRNATVLIPSGDVGIANNQYATLGSLAQVVSGGIA